MSLSYIRTPSFGEKYIKKDSRSKSTERLSFVYYLAFFRL